VESNLLGNVRLDAVRNLLPLFGALWGSDAGARLRKVAHLRSWPLVWALGDAGAGGSPAPHFPPAHQPSPLSLRFPGNQRLLDPLSAASLNVSFPPNATATYEQLWAEAKAARRQGARPSAARVKEWWARLAPAMVPLAPLSASSCADVDGCIGVHAASGDCVCRSAQRGSAFSAPAGPYSLVPGDDDFNPLCYQAPNESYANLTLRVDFTVRKHTKHLGGCAGFGYEVYIENDPILKAAELFRKRLVEP